ncbi:MAG: hypothetical protein K2K19_04195 [Acetatifactor sp.]|nr:hypothetical protein [Acetatifactor sp.]
MTKKEAISVITRCARLYAENLCDEQLAFLYRDSSNKVHIVEVIFRANNFMHLTGIETKQHQTAGSFYRDAIEQRLKESNLFFKDPHTTELKLKILPNIMNIAYTARMIGDYTGSCIDLYTEKVAGTTTACLGLLKNKNDYVPNTILSEDIWHITPHPPGRIFAIFKKSVKDAIYSELTYQSKSIELTRKCLPNSFINRIKPELFGL